MPEVLYDCVSTARLGFLAIAGDILDFFLSAIKNESGNSHQRAANEEIL